MVGGPVPAPKYVLVREARKSRKPWLVFRKPKAPPMSSEPWKISPSPNTMVAEWWRASHLASLASGAPGPGFLDTNCTPKPSATIASPYLVTWGEGSSDLPWVSGREACLEDDQKPDEGGPDPCTHQHWDAALKGHQVAGHEAHE